MGLIDKHLAYGDDIPQTRAEKDCYWKMKSLEEQSKSLKKMDNKYEQSERLRLRNAPTVVEADDAESEVEE